MGECLSCGTGSAFRRRVECAEKVYIRQRPPVAGAIRRQRLELSAVVVAGRNARNVRAVETDIGQFPVAELGQFGDIALIVAERLDHSDEREQHGSLLEFWIQLLSSG